MYMLSYQCLHHALIRLHTSKLEYRIRHLGLLKWFGPVLRTDLAIPHWLLLRRANVAVRPVGGANVVLEAVLLGLERLLLGEDARRHADVLHVADLLALGEARVVDGARVPEHKVAGLHVDLDHLAPARLEPLEVLLAEQEEVHELELRRRRILVVSRLALVREELVEELGGALHQHQAAVLGAVGSVVEEALHGLHTAACELGFLQMERETYPLR